MFAVERSTGGRYLGSCGGLWHSMWLSVSGKFVGFLQFLNSIFRLCWGHYWGRLLISCECFAFKLVTCWGTKRTPDIRTFKYFCGARAQKYELKKIIYACLSRIIREGGAKSFKVAVAARFSIIPPHSVFREFPSSDLWYILTVHLCSNNGAILFFRNEFLYLPSSCDRIVAKAILNGVPRIPFWTGGEGWFNQDRANCERCDNCDVWNCHPSYSKVSC